VDVADGEAVAEGEDCWVGVTVGSLIGPIDFKYKYKADTTITKTRPIITTVKRTFLKSGFSFCEDVSI